MRVLLFDWIITAKCPLTVLKIFVCFLMRTKSDLFLFQPVTLLVRLASERVPRAARNAARDTRWRTTNVKVIQNHLFQNQVSDGGLELNKLFFGKSRPDSLQTLFFFPG